MSLIRNNRAFSLVETLTVLLVTTVLLGITVLVPARFNDVFTEKAFIAALKQKIELTQQYALVSGQDGVLIVDAEHHDIKTNMPQDKGLRIPGTLSCHSSRLIFKKSTGQLVKYQQLTFASDYHTYVFKLQFGKGVFWIDQQ